MKTNFIELKKLIEGMDDSDYMMDNDLNLNVLSPTLKRQILAQLNLDKKLEVSRFLTMVICFLENEVIDDDLTIWTEIQYVEYLKSCGIDENTDSQYVEEFLLNFRCGFF